MIGATFRRGRPGEPFKGFLPIPGRSPVVCKSAEEAVSYVQSGQRIYFPEGAGTPRNLVKALNNRAGEVRNVECVLPFITVPEGVDPFNKDDEAHHISFRGVHPFVGPQDRKTFKRKFPHATFVPLTLHEIPQHFHSPDFPIDAAFLNLSPPDRHGWCTLGPSCLITRAGLNAAKFVFAEIHKRLPRTHGNTQIHYSQLDYVIETDGELPQFPTAKLTEVEIQIGKNIASITPDGACLQAGVGGIPNAALLFLRNHKNLGIHSEMFGEGVIDLLEAGAITGLLKELHPGKIVAGLAMGTDRLYRTIDDNPLFQFESMGYVNDPRIISQNSKVVAINSALQVDLTGQINSETFGLHQFSAVGGQADFVRGASLSEGGLPIIALPATGCKQRVSRIVPILTPGSVASVSRGDGVIVVTEYGIAKLWGLNTRQRASALIKVAHPKFREELAKQAAEVYGHE